MPRLVIMFLICGVILVTGAHGSTGITGLIVFGDSLSDSGNMGLLQAGASGNDQLPSRSRTYHPDGRATNGRVWIEIVAEQLDLEALPSLAGGVNFAFLGAEAGHPSSGGTIPGFAAQVQMLREARRLGEIDPSGEGKLIVVWFGQDAFQRILETENRPVSLPEIQSMVSDIAKGITDLYREGARTFLVPSLPPMELTPLGNKLLPHERDDLADKVGQFNRELEAALIRIERVLSPIRIVRLDMVTVFEDFQARPEAYGFTNVANPAFYPPANIKLTNWEDQYLFWDSTQPTESGHAAIAARALETLSGTPWWGEPVLRNPDGDVRLGIGLLDDQNWPWVFCRNIDGGIWLWVNGAQGTVEGFHAYRPDRSQWIFLNANNGWAFDYATGDWIQLIP